MTLERIEHKVFASEAPLDEMGQFGSALATTKLNTKDVAEIQALPAYTKGWGSAIISENNYPAMEEMNGVLNVMSYHTGYLYQEGIPIYSATQEYSATSWVKDLAGEKVYKSLQGGNKGHDLTDSAWWEDLKLGGGGLANKDLSNLSEIGQAKFDEKANKTELDTKLDKKLDKSTVNSYLIETYSSGTSWYRIWSNGWCEQGGRTSSSSGSATRTVTLLKAYTNANYSLTLTGMSGGSSGNPHFNVFQCTSISAKNFKAQAECSESLVLGWRASGWKA